MLFVDWKVCCVNSRAHLLSQTYSGLLSTSARCSRTAALAINHFVERTDSHQLIQPHLYWWTTNPIISMLTQTWDSGHQGSTKGSKIRHEKPKQTGWYSQRRNSWRNICFVYLCRKANVPFVSMTLFHIHMLTYLTCLVQPVINFCTKSSSTETSGSWALQLWAIQKQSWCYSWIKLKQSY